LEKYLYQRGKYVFLREIYVFLPVIYVFLQRKYLFLSSAHLKGAFSIATSFPLGRLPLKIPLCLCGELIFKMPNPQIPLEARQTVLDQIVAGASFTAYEITLEVRRRLGVGVEVPHPEVNAIVQAMFSSGHMAGYDRAPDASVKAATPPFRYAPRVAENQAGIVQSAPAAVLSVNRANLPVHLRYSNPVAAVVREYALEARAFHDAANIGDTPFEVYFPTAQQPSFRVRSFGAVPSESEVIARYSLSPNDTRDFGAKAAYAYVNEFRITTFQNGTARTFRASLDHTLIGTVVKDGEVPTNARDGVEIEVPVNEMTVRMNFFGRETVSVLAFFRVAPQIRSGVLGVFSKPKTLFEGNGWRITDSGGAVAVMGDVAFPITYFGFLPSVSLLNVQLDFAQGELAVTDNDESLDYTGSTRLALIDAFKRVEDEAEPLIGASIAAPSTLWDAKIRFVQLQKNFPDFTRGKSFEWQGIPIQNARFEQFNPAEVSVWNTTRLPSGRLRTRSEFCVEAEENVVVVWNDLKTRTGSPARLREWFASHPETLRVVVLSPINEDAKERFIRDNHFESVPTLCLSSLPKPTAAQTKTPRVSRPVAFDASKHSIQPIGNSLAANFASLSDAAFSDLQRWVLEAPLDGGNWPDWKRLWKRLESRVWPLLGRNRWSKSESDVPADATLASEREAILLGAMIGRFDAAQEFVRRSGASPASPNFLSRLAQFFGVKANQSNGPSEQTVAYLRRRTTRLFCFLRDANGVSPQRRALLAPLVAGCLLRSECADVASTLPARLALLESEILNARPDLVRLVWNDATLALPILKWAFAWLRARNYEVEGTPLHVRRFAFNGDALETLAILPAVLELGAPWFTDYGLVQLAHDLQMRGSFWEKRGEVLRLFARFRQLPVNGDWLQRTLDVPEANEPEVVDFVASYVRTRAQNNEFGIVTQLSPALQKIFCDALAEARPNGLDLSEWAVVVSVSLIEPLAPALLRMPMDGEVARLLWFNPNALEDWLRVGGESVWLQAFAPEIEKAASAEEFDFARRLPASGRALFFESIGRNLSANTWKKLGNLAEEDRVLFAPDARNLPLSDAFWNFLNAQEAQFSDSWLEFVGRERAQSEFAKLSAALVSSLLESGAGGLDSLVSSWIKINLSSISPDDELLLQLATSNNTTWRRASLERISARPMSLRVALRLIEGGPPEAQLLARPFFEQENPDWQERVLALADSPNREAQRMALDLLARFPNRWTSALLTQLAQHDNSNVQAFVARNLSRARQSEAVAAFGNALTNARGRARRAKTHVQQVLDESPNTGGLSLDVLLDAARNGAPRDREWAVRQLVKLQLSGVDVPDLKVKGAVAGARNGLG